MAAIIIAEAGVNHNGNLDLAKKLIDVASDAGVDYVKFQTFKAEKLVSKEAVKAEYQQRNTVGSNENLQLKMLQKLELSEYDHLELIRYCKEKGVNFLSTGFDEESLSFLYNIGIRLFKVPSGEITNLPYLKHLASLADSVILSTGMSDIDEIRAAINILTKHGVNKNAITVLHCNTEYPTPIKDVNLRAMQTIASELFVDIGYSDHTLGIEIPIAAVALGAKIIEKHFTLDKTMEGPDHKASLEPNELSLMVKSIRNIENAMGNGVKEPSPSEISNIVVARKSIHLKNELKKGQTISESDLIMLRPGDGISPMLMEQVIGKKVSKDIPEGHKIVFNDLQL